MTWIIGLGAQSADDAKLIGASATLEGRIRMKNDLDKLEKLLKIKQIKFTKDKYKPLDLGKKTNAQIQIGKQLAKL